MGEKKEEFEIRFWRAWLYADFLEREKLVENLPIVRDCANLSKLPENIRVHTFATLLNGFFEDLESAVYTKIRLEEKKVESKRK